MISELPETARRTKGGRHNLRDRRESSQSGLSARLALHHQLHELVVLLLHLHEEIPYLAHAAQTASSECLSLRMLARPGLGIERKPLSPPCPQH